MISLDFALKALAILVIVWGLLNIALPSMRIKFSITVLFFMFFAIVIAAFIGTMLLAANLLYSGALIFTGFTDLLLFLVLTAALSTLFMLGVEETVVKVLEKLGMDKIWAETGFAFVHGLATALLLMLVASYMPGVELASGAALTAGLVGAFGFYFAELVFTHSGTADTEEMAFMETSLEDEED